MTVSYGPWKVKCAAKSKRSGKPCQKWAVKGSTVCSMHGAGGPSNSRDANGRALNAKTAANDRMSRINERISELAEEALEVVAAEMRAVAEDGTELRGSRATDRLKAADMILERAVAKKLQHEHSESREQALRDEVEELLAEHGLDATGTEDEL